MKESKRRNFLDDPNMGIILFWNNNKNGGHINDRHYCILKFDIYINDEQLDH
jgi:hypothetical protein